MVGKLIKKKYQKVNKFVFFFFLFKKSISNLIFLTYISKTLGFSTNFCYNFFFLYFVSLFVYKFEAMRSDDKGNLFESLENNKLMSFFLKFEDLLFWTKENTKLLFFSTISTETIFFFKLS